MDVDEQWVSSDASYLSPENCSNAWLRALSTFLPKFAWMNVWDFFSHYFWSSFIDLNFFLLYFKVSRNKETNVKLKDFYWQNKIHEKLKKNRSAIQDKIVGNVLNLERLILFQKKLANANRFSETEQVNSWKSMLKTCLYSTNNKQTKKKHYELAQWSDTFEVIEPYTYRFIIKLFFGARKFVQKAV